MGEGRERQRRRGRVLYHGVSVHFRLLFLKKILFFRSSKRLFASKHKRSRIRSNSGPVTMDTIVPLRRSKREKRLLFSNLNQQEIYQHMINGPHYQVMDFSDVS